MITRGINSIREEIMAYLNWTDELSVGIARIDQQHQKIVGFLNDLYEAMQAGKGLAGETHPGNGQEVGPFPGR